MWTYKKSDVFKPAYEADKHRLVLFTKTKKVVQVLISAEIYIYMYGRTVCIHSVLKLSKRLVHCLQSLVKKKSNCNEI